MGWLRARHAVKAMSGLTQRDIDELKQKISEEAKQDEGRATEGQTDIAPQSERLTSLRRQMDR
jgi:hypothetical protein